MSVDTCASARQGLPVSTVTALARLAVRDSVGPGSVLTLLTATSAPAP